MASAAESENCAQLRPEVVDRQTAHWDCACPLNYSPTPDTPATVAQNGEDRLFTGAYRIFCCSRLRTAAPYLLTSFPQHQKR